MAACLTAKRIFSFAAALCFVALPARADYVVLRSGTRIHVTGYERDGGTYRLTIPGGSAQVAAKDVVAIEPEDTFRALPPAPAAATAAASNAYAGLIHAAAQKQGLDEALITDVIAAESHFDPKAVSRKQARGLMQLLPQTAARYNVNDVFDPAQNIEAGTHYLKELLGKYRGNLQLALAAYNAGPDVVARYGGVPPFAETRQYVHRVLAAYGKSYVVLQ